MASGLRPFHLAIPVNDLGAAADFYCGILGCATGRTAERWTDLDFFGHQVSLHLAEDHVGHADTNPVDGDKVPASHFGIILTMPDWQALAERLQAHDCEFLIEPRVRFQGEVGEQATMFLYDPSGNALEFKSFADDSQVFAQ